MNKSKISLIISFAIIALLPISAHSEPVGTVFTYQGRLIDANNPASGLFDFQFKLYDSESGGGQLNDDVIKSEVSVIDGYFTVELDFGSVFDGNERWLGIGVRQNDPIDQNSYTVLSPRQKLTAAPYALFALNGGSSDVNSRYSDVNSNWIITESNMYSGVSGNVGIGTPNPATKLDVAGIIRSAGGNSDNWNMAYSHKTTEDLISGLVKCDGLGTYYAVTDNSANWDAAYSWGNHALAGYLTTEIDPIFGSSAARGISSGNITNWNTAYGWGNHAAAGYITSETDPVFAVSAARGISSGNINIWNAAYGHKAFEDSINGLIKSNGAGVYSAIIDNSANWNAAYEMLNTIENWNVKAFGAQGNGIDDDTNAFSTAIAAAAGREIFVPDGTYILDNLYITTDTCLKLSSGAVLKHKSKSILGVMIVFLDGTLRIHGGTFDGNKDNQTVWSCIIGGYLESGKRIEASRTKFTNSVLSAFYIMNFGGTLLIDDCEFSHMSDGSENPAGSCAIGIVNGEPNTPGFMRVSNSRFIGDIKAVADGKSAGGMFLYADNGSTLEVENCYFYGIGQYYGSYDIAGIHVYPRWNGVRIVNNYFDQCSFAAICVKSVHNFICTGNVISNGQTAPKYVISEGAIAYDPGYQPWHEDEQVVHPRAVISNNIIDNPGSQTDVGKVACIAVHGTPESYAKDVIISNNVLRNGGYGILIVCPSNLTIANNIIEGASDGNAGTEHGIYFANCFGEIIISGNRITTPNGMGLYCVTDANTSKWYIIGNTFNHSSPDAYACTLRGVNYAKFTGNTFNATAGYSLILKGSDINTPIGWLAWDNSNTILAGPTTFNWDQISKASGFLSDDSSPYNLIVPAEAGTIYRQTSGNGNVLWQSMGTTKTSWVRLSTSNIIPSVDSTSAVKILKADGVTSVVNVDTVNNNVGIGTISPARALHISDVMRIQPRSTSPSSPAEGDIYMDNSQHKLMVYDGNAWQACW